VTRFAVGHTFPPTSVAVTVERVQAYLAAVEEGNDYYQKRLDIAPPLAVAAWVLAELIQNLDLPSGSVHATQEFQFLAPIPVPATVHAAARVVQASSRGGLAILVVEVRLTHEGQEVQVGRSMLMMPPEGTSPPPPAAQGERE